MKVKKNQLRVILGTMTFGGQTGRQEAARMLENFLPGEVDTARMYERGRTEELLGEMLPKGTLVASKANPFATHDKSLAPASIEAQLKATEEALRGAPLSIYYLHAPDPETPILETLEAINAAHSAGRFLEFGLSNFQAWEVAHIAALCRENGFVVPTVYQGMYNALTREVERELLPCLRALGMRFYAYNPLMGGMLTGKHSRESLVKASEGRFALSNKMYRDRYLAASQLEAVEAIVAACREASIKPGHAALRWLVHHSHLKENDGVIIGASKVAHFEDNLGALQSEDPLPTPLLKACDAGWATIQAHGCCPSYERGHSKYGDDDE
ncbi:hypothetical protein CTAYLR_007622 [Chrysophaeum taylorii]|uniref:NADP-dependent oxidoreductase domain-containing protein n=1 Tax=Chrysophaeum taylorii TaxID=2483200 RepID=A0AAD7XLI6_9STRA|nr:hypothetical protein CTAYLR_007622 [Chrysophaeum taylorii]